ncbi:sulfur carrier protein ThiS adenylyltransferase ThiF [Desulfobulbus alkaliphilus]|uniref:sulfur carrier protein ThiS adenylyltransferase ThiF n=1 Tax=Desulfobulbus alkaliphilus TaxID=869814 RepID=UPI0019662EE1|nr:sulfur carrier protein ThiS adenylyltransferase ThiF [Desulfobulbus alkaliphilus]MBM9535814.1 sulfur carrier protein ThiS adenylyltransferase ThiF [Desulfobulbus alkaliphilus]
MKIAIAGVGGIGSNVAVNLVRSGISFLKIVDYDRVEFSNLNRQFYFHDQIGRFKVEALAENLKRIRPELEVEAVVDRVDVENCQSLFSGCDLIVEGFDRQQDKKMLVEYLGSERMLVLACGIAGSDLACIRSRRLGTCCIVGDFATDCQQAPLFAHKVTTVAGFMTEFIVQQGIKYGKKID